MAKIIFKVVAEMMAFMPPPTSPPGRRRLAAAAPGTFDLASAQLLGQILEQSQSAVAEAASVGQLPAAAMVSVPPEQAEVGNGLQGRGAGPRKLSGAGISLASAPIQMWERGMQGARAGLAPQSESSRPMLSSECSSSVLPPTGGGRGAGRPEQHGHGDLPFSGVPAKDCAGGIHNPLRHRGPAGFGGAPPGPVCGGGLTLGPPGASPALSRRLALQLFLGGESCLRPPLRTMGGALRLVPRGALSTTGWLTGWMAGWGRLAEYCMPQSTPLKVHCVVSMMLSFLQGAVESAVLAGAIPEVAPPPAPAPPEVQPPPQQPEGQGNRKVKGQAGGFQRAPSGTSLQRRGATQAAVCSCALLLL